MYGNKKKIQDFDFDYPIYFLLRQDFFQYFHSSFKLMKI